MKYYQTLEYYHAAYDGCAGVTLYTLDNQHFLPWNDFVKTLKVEPCFVKVLQVIEDREGETVYCDSRVMFEYDCCKSNGACGERG